MALLGKTGKTEKERLEALKSANVVLGDRAGHC